MAVPPTIPTSFVPKQPVAMHPRHTESGNSAFLVVSLFIVGIAALLAIGVFAYGRYLDTQAADKAAELEKAQKSVSQDTVEGFLRLRNRLTSANTVLSQHVALSQFFDALEKTTLADVSFSNLTVAVEDDRTASIKMAGVAKNFNALAAQSAAFAATTGVKQAIFSGITVDKNGVVSFTMNANLDPKLIELSAAAIAPPAATPAAPTTPAAPAPAAPSASSTSAEATTTP